MIILATYQGAHIDCQRIWPGYRYILIPPALHNDGHIEAQYKGERYEGSMVTAVTNNIFKKAGTEIEKNSPDSSNVFVFRLNYF